MSYDTNRNWVYQVVGRNIELWVVSKSGALDTVGDYKIRLPDDVVGRQLVYPTEDISQGLMFEGTAYIEPFVTSDPNELANGANPSLTEDLAPSEVSHVNLNRMFTLALVDYIKAMWSDNQGDIGKKEYYMREFWKKAADAQSNKFGVSIVTASTVYSVR